MPARAVRTGAGRRSTKRKPADAVAADRAAAMGQDAGSDDWMEVEESSERLDEGAMEMLLTGHAATHGIEGEDNWLLQTEETQWGER